MYTFIVLSSPPPLPLHLLLMQYSRSKLAFRTLIIVPSILYLLSLYPHHPLMFLVVFLCLLLHLSPLTPLGFLNERLEVSEPRALNYHTLSRIILLILFVSRNLSLIYFPFSRSLDLLLCDLIAPTPSWHSLSQYYAR